MIGGTGYTDFTDCVQGESACECSLLLTWVCTHATAGGAKPMTQET